MRYGVLIALPTPLSRQREPDLSYIESAATSLAPMLQRDQVVVLESTTWPGTTREILQPLLEERLGPEGGRRLPPGDVAGARRPRPRGLDDEDDPQGRRRDQRGVDEGRRRPLPVGARHRARGLDAGGGRADEAAREHLSRRQHRARQRARAAERPDGDRRVGSRRRGRDEAVRVRVVQAGAGTRAATASRSTPSTSRGRRASSTSRPGSSSSRARSTTTCRTSAAR